LLQPTTTTNATTTFQEAGLVSTFEVGKELRNPSDVMPVDIASIKDFLAKPISVTNGNYTTSTVPKTTLATYDILKLVQNTAMWAQKVRGYRFMRGTCVIRLQLQAEPFQAGRLRLCYLPCPGIHGSVTGSGYNAYKSSHTYTLTNISTLPGIDVDVHDTGAELRIPYIQPYSYMNLMDDDGWVDPLTSPGRFYLVAYCPSLGTTTNIPYRIYAHWEDVELTGPDFTGESSRIKTKSFKKAILSKEAEDTSDKPISSTLAKFAAATKMLGNVPFLGSYASMASGAASMGAKVAEALGYSKPQNLGVTQPVLSLPTWTAGNADGLSNADVVALNPSHTLEPVPFMMGSSIDEMSFAHIKSVSGWFHSFDWTNTDLVGAELYSFYNRPQNYSSPWSDGTVTGLAHVPFSYLATGFAYWRGSVDLTLRFVKSPMTMGTLSVEYYPDQATLTSTSNSAYVLREIVDLKNQDEVTISIPYMKEAPWCHTNDTAGKIVIRIINPLVLPSTAGTKLTVLCYANGGSDFEYALPWRTSLMPFSGESDTHLPLKKKLIGSGNLLKDDAVVNLTTIGDPIYSLKTLFNKMSRTIIPTNTLNTTILVGDFSASCGVASSGTATTYNASFLNDNIAYYSNGFCFQRGSVRIMALANAGSTAWIRGAAITYSGDPIGKSVTVDPTATQTAAGTTWSTLSSNAIDYVTTARTDASFCEIRYPIYRGTPFGAAKYYVNDDDFTDGYTLKRPDIPTMACFLKSNATISEVQRAAGDDFALGMFIGFAPLIYVG